MSEEVKLKKGRSQFMLIGEFKLNDYVFSLNKTSQNGFNSNRLNLPLNCGNDNIIYSEMWGGFSETKESKLYVHGKKMNDNNKEVDDWKARFEVNFEDRNNPTILETIGERCFITIGIEKDTNGKTVQKRFLSPYDAIQYLSDNLEDGTVLNVKGDIEYSIYNDSLQLRKNITSIYLSGKEPEDYKAEFTQTILVDENSLQKANDEAMTVEVKARVLDYNKAIKGLAPYDIKLEIPYTEETKATELSMAERLYRAKKDINEIEITGQFIESAPLVSIKDIDISDDIKFLLEIGSLKEEDVVAKAIGNQKKTRRMFIKCPNMKNVEIDGSSETRLALNIAQYTEADLFIQAVEDEKVNIIKESESSDLNEALNDLGL